jgi:apolipoprotein N-acyltransferase
VGLALATLTGLLYYASFPGLDIWPLAFIAFLPWVVALRGRTPGQAALQGLLVGLVVGVLGFYWLLGMLREFSGFPVAVCAVFMLLLCAYQGGRFVLLGWLHARAERRGWPAAPVFIAAFAASETAYPLLFPFSFGATMHDVHPVVQVAELGGPTLVALVTLAPGWALGAATAAWLAGRQRDAGLLRGLWAGAAEVGRVWVGLALAAPLLASAYGLARIAQVDAAVAAAPKLRVGVVQANMSLKSKREEREEGLRRHVELTGRLRKEHDVDFVVWPETSVAGAVEEKDVARFYERFVTRKLRVPALVGAVIARKVDDARGFALSNSALISDGKGVIRGRYDKQFLLAFGEYLPLGELFPVLYEWSPNSGQFSPGRSFEPLPLGDHPIAVFICYEDIVPSFVNRLMKDGRPELLVNMTNDAWFGDTSEPWEHMTLAKLRAVEQRRFLVRSTNSGISGIVDPVGRMLASTPTFEVATLAEEVALLRLDTPYRHLGDVPLWVLTALALAMAFLRRPGRA